MNIIETIKLALTSVWANKMRSFLTMLGIIIGISSVITIMALGEGSQSKIQSEFKNIGINRVAFFTNWENEKVDPWMHSFKEEEVQRVKSIFKDDIAAINGRGNIQGKVENKKKPLNVGLNGVYENYKEIEPINVIKGRFLRKNDLDSKRNVGVIDQKLAIKLFGGDDVLGEKVKVNSSGEIISVTIVGIYKKPDSAFDKLAASFGEEESYIIYFPMTTMMQINDYDRYDYIEVSIKEGKNIDLVSEKILKYLHRMKGLDDKTPYYRFSSAKAQMNQMGSILSVVSGVIGAIAAISLLVGGIGIMNIMLVSVTERTREIGIRKAIGASKNVILTQFLIESMIISGLGGIIGTSLGAIIAKVAGMQMGFDGVISPTVVFIAVSFSCGVGIFFGIYPANKAAKMDPIEALRYE